MTMNTYKRRRFFIDKQFQTKYMLLVIFMLLLYTIIFVGVLFIPQLLPFIFSASLDEKISASEILLIYHKNVWPALFVVIPLFGFFSIFITHKIAGPVYRFKTRLRQLTQWDLHSRVTLRKGDDFQELADDINLVSEELLSLASVLKQNYDSLSNNIEKIQKHIEDGIMSKEEGRELITDLSNCRKNISETLERFKM